LLSDRGFAGQRGADDLDSWRSRVHGGAFGVVDCILDAIGHATLGEPVDDHLVLLLLVELTQDVVVFVLGGSLLDDDDIVHEDAVQAQVDCVALLLGLVVEQPGLALLLGLLDVRVHQLEEVFLTVVPVLLVLLPRSLAEFGVVLKFLLQDAPGVDPLQVEEFGHLQGHVLGHVVEGHEGELD